MEGFLRKVARYDKNVCVVFGQDPKIPIYGGNNMLQGFLQEVAQNDKTSGKVEKAGNFTVGSKK